ncbi:PD-(D/E)XK motif protein [Solibacillus sp. FSL H8-0538]|uniref:PD-(D/E)XK motif protein n=1 Tax=Solibacillus sp. FSL H8-0538 TaxID=2921400 RepID=UPI0030F5FBB0
MSNPWEKLTPLTQNRVKNIHQHVIHWVADANNRVGLMIQCKESSFTEDHLIKLKGIQVELDKTSSPNKLILILNDKSDLEIFEVLCKDLISVAAANENDQDMISKMAQRLLRWKKLLQQDLKNSFSPQKQMGLFGELTFIQTVLKDKIGLEESIKNWNGPKFEKQDFVLENSAAEVKTYKTSNEKVVEISSKEQLYTPKENLFLAAFSLSENRAGYTVKDLVNDISENAKDPLIQELFMNKIEAYGFFPELVKEPLISFIVDDSTYYKIESEFPRIIPGDLSQGIQRLKYTIDLTSCNAFEVEKEEMEF